MSLVLRLTMLLCIPIMFGAAIAVSRLTRRGKNRDRAVIAVAVASPVLFFIVPLILAGDWPGPYSPLVLHEGPFTWPAGCANRLYRDGDEISITCQDSRNMLPRKLALDHGLPMLMARSEHDYYRVGAEAINFNCNYIIQRCTVRHAEPNVFQ
jgi:hypothetical protein